MQYYQCVHNNYDIVRHGCMSIFHDHSIECCMQLYINTIVYLGPDITTRHGTHKIKRIEGGDDSQTYPMLI